MRGHVMDNGIAFQSSFLWACWSCWRPCPQYITLYTQILLFSPNYKLHGICLSVEDTTVISDESAEKRFYATSLVWMP